MSWHDYNDSLVERGRIIFDLGFADRWKSELKSMNKHKVGRPFDFNFLDELGIEPAIKIRKNAGTRSRGSPLEERQLS